MFYQVESLIMQGRIQDFKLGGELKKIAPSGGRRENVWGISCEKMLLKKKSAPGNGLLNQMCFNF